MSTDKSNTPSPDSNGTSKDSPQSPWKFRIWRIAIARKGKEGNPVIRWASGYVKLSDRIFWEHRIRKGDVIQIRKGWDTRYEFVFGVVDAIFLENLDIRLALPAKNGTQMIKMRNVPAGAVSRVGKCPMLFKANRRRNPEKVIEQAAKLQAEKDRVDSINRAIIEALPEVGGIDSQEAYHIVVKKIEDITRPEFIKLLNKLMMDGKIVLDSQGVKYRRA